MKKLFFAIIIAALLFILCLQLARMGVVFAKGNNQNQCNANNPENCPEPTVICGNGNHTHNPHCEPSPISASPSVSLSASPTPTRKPKNWCNKDEGPTYTITPEPTPSDIPTFTISPTESVSPTETATTTPTTTTAPTAQPTQSWQEEKIIYFPGEGGVIYGPQK